MTDKYNNFSQLQMIFKVQFGKQIHLVNSGDKQKINQFSNFLPTVFKTIPERFTLSYLDEDGDQITLKDQSDYEVLLKSGLKSVRITIRENNEEFIEATNQVHFQEPSIESIQQKISEIKIVHDASLLEQPSFDQHFAPKKTEMIEEFQPQIQKVEESLIEQKLKRMLPSIISQIKAEISQEIKEKSRQSISRSEKNMKNEPIFIKESYIHEKINRVPSEVVHYRVNCDGCGQKGIVGIRYKCAICPDFDFCERCEATIEHDHPFLKIKNLRQTPKQIMVAIEDENESIEINGQRSQVPQYLSDLLNNGFSIVEGFLANKNGEEIKKETKPQQSKQKQVIIEKKGQVPRNEEMVNETKPTLMRNEREPEKMEIEQSYEQILNKANYLVEVFDFKFEKCIRYAQNFPHLSKEELLNYCISCPEFFDERN